MNDLFTTTIPQSIRETWRRQDCLRHAREWETIAKEQPNTPRGRTLAADARATAERLRSEAMQSPNED